MTDTLPVLFRRPRGKAAFENDGVTAVFPTLPGVNAYDMTCYAHVGQHGACNMGWYYSTRPATPAEYADLMDELIRIYSTGEDAVTLQPVSRITRTMVRERRNNAR